MRYKQIPFTEIDGQVAYEKHQEIISNEKIRRKLLADNMISLIDMFNTQGYKVILGEENGEWKSYLADLEIFYPRYKIEKWRKIHKVLVKECGIDISEVEELPESRLEFLSRILRPEMSDISVWIEKAKVLTNQDWKDEIAPFLGKVDSNQCKHEKTEVIEVCKICGFKHKVDEKHGTEE